jgi:hypothetical protein
VQYLASRYPEFKNVSLDQFESLMILAKAQAQIQYQ